MIAVAAGLGYLIGSIPTAVWLARIKGVNLRRDGSGNPGTANALKTSGPWVAISVLTVEAAKGFGAVWIGYLIADEVAAVASGVGAIAGNVYNVWYGFTGGKGLGISLGVLAALWPWVLVPIVAIIALGALITRSSGTASLLAVLGLNVSAVLWPAVGWETGGLAADSHLLVISIGIGLLISWKHWRDSPLSGRDRYSRREPRSPAPR